MATSPLRVYSISGTSTAKVSHRTNPVTISRARRRLRSSAAQPPPSCVEATLTRFCGLPDCDLPELGQRHLVSLDADDSARRTLGRSLAALVRLLLARAPRLVALP